MSVYPCVIVGTDGSPTASEAVRRAAVLAAGLGARLLVAAAFQPTRPEDLGPPSVRAQMPGEGWVGVNYQAAANIAQEAAGMARRLVEVAVDTATPEGDPAAALLDVAGRHPGSLLVVGSQGTSATTRFLLGSVPSRIAHHAVGDVLVARTGDTAGTLPRRVLVGTDGSARAGRAVARALEVATALGAEVTILCAHGDAGRARAVVDEAGRAAAVAGVAWHPLVRHGHAAEAVVAAARDHDLVVIGNKGMTGPGRFLLGSVSNRVSHHVTTDLLIVKTDG